MVSVGSHPSSQAIQMFGFPLDIAISAEPQDGKASGRQRPRRNRSIIRMGQIPYSGGHDKSHRIARTAAGHENRRRHGNLLLGRISAGDKAE